MVVVRGHCSCLKCRCFLRVLRKSKPIEKCLFSESISRISNICIAILNAFYCCSLVTMLVLANLGLRNATKPD